MMSSPGVPLITPLPVIVASDGVVHGGASSSAPAEVTPKDVTATNVAAHAPTRRIDRLIAVPPSRHSRWSFGSLAVRAHDVKPRVRNRHVIWPLRADWSAYATGDSASANAGPV